MTWWRIDPAAEAVIHSLKTEPERWTASYKSLWLDTAEKHDSPLTLWMFESPNRLAFERPTLDINRLSQRALWKAYEAWKRARGESLEQERRTEIAAALRPLPTPPL